METLRKLIEMLAVIETGITRRRAANRAARAAFRITLNRCRV